MRNGYPKTMKDYAITTLSNNPEKTYKEVASELGVNTETIRQWWLKEHDGNSRAKNHPGRRSNYSEEFRKNAVEMVYMNPNKTVKAISEELNISKSMLSNWWSKAVALGIYKNNRADNGKNAIARFNAERKTKVHKNENVIDSISEISRLKMELDKANTTINALKLTIVELCK